MSLDVETLVNEFRSAAIEKGDFAEEKRDHVLYEVMLRTFLKLRMMGSPGNHALVELLEDESVFVRSWIAAALVVEGNKRAYRVLKDIARIEGMTGFRAGVALKEFNAGRLSSPFPDVLRD